MVTALAPYAIVIGVVGAIGLLLASSWQRLTAPLGPLVESYRLALEQADVQIKGEELLLGIVGGAAAAWFGAVMLLHLDPLRGMLIFPLALIVAMYGVKGWISRKKKKRLAVFTEQLELVLRLMASGLRAGLGLRQSMVLVIDELDDPARKEFMRVIGQANIGMSVYDALDTMAKRMPSDESNMLVRAIRIQSQTGGNLGKVLEHLAGTIKERRRIYRKMRALTAEGRMSAIVIALLPIIVCALICAFQADMRHALFQTGLGGGVMIVVAFLELIGVVMLRKMLDFQV